MTKDKFYSLFGKLHGFFLTGLNLPGKIAYAVLMFPAALTKPRNWLVFGLLFVGYSGVIELLQPFVNRYGEWLDMAANSAGVDPNFTRSNVFSLIEK